MYRDKDCVEKLFSSVKSDIGIRPIRAWTDDGVYGVLLIGFLAQAPIAMTRLLAKPADGKATKFISDAMQKLTLTVRRRDGGYGVHSIELQLVESGDPQSFRGHSGGFPM